MQSPQTEIIEKATNLFWQKGFQAAGMRDIQQALDMRPGSIYARFKSKEGLFQLVIEHYVTTNKEQLKAIANSPQPLNALQQFFVATLTSTEQERYKRQCLLIKSITELEILSKNSKQAVKNAVNTIKESFKEIIIKAIQTNTLPQTTPPDTAADWLQNQFVALRMYAQTQNDNNAINTMVEKVFIDLQNQWPE